MTRKHKIRVRILGIVFLFLVSVAVSYPPILGFSPKLEQAVGTLKLHLGLDLQGGVHLEYKADTSVLEEESHIPDAMLAASAVIERRVNAYGVSESVVQIAQSGDEHRIIVELPGVKEIEEAKGLIKDTPFLEFKELDEENEEVKSLVNSLNEDAKKRAEETLKRVLDGEDFEDVAKEVSEDGGAQENGGDLGFVKKGIFPEEFDTALFDTELADGQVYDKLVETDFGWHIFQKVEERTVPKEDAPEEELAEPLDEDTSTNTEVVDEGSQEISEQSEQKGESFENLEENTQNRQIEESNEEELQVDVTEENSEELEFEREVRGRQIFIQKHVPQEFPDLLYVKTELTGKNLKSASVEINGGHGGLGEPVVALRFDDEGKKLFGEITKRNMGQPIAIYIDNELVTAPVVQAEITSGEAIITLGDIPGGSALEEAQELKKRLDEGALPVPLELVSQQSIDASLGQKDLEASIKAGLIGLGLVMLYMIIFYRLFGVVAAFSLVLYAALLILLFKLSSVGGWPWPITLTLPGIAGFVLSIGMAVDANVLIFERVREEIRSDKSMSRSVNDGFKRAWRSIWDANLSTLIIATILIWLGTGFVKGFAIILFIGVSLSMFTAIVIVRSMLESLPMRKLEKNTWIVMGRLKK